MNNNLSDNKTFFYRMSTHGHFQINPTEHINRAYLYGDGIFETMIFTRTEIRFRKHHLDRAAKGCSLLNLEIDILEAFHQIEKFLLKNYTGEILRVRWNIFRDSMGKYTPQCNQTQQSLIIEPFIYTPPQNKTAFINEHFHVPTLPWSNCKTLNAMVYVQAGIVRNNAGYEEIILLDAKGNLCEAGAANLFWVKNNIFHTPSLESSCIEGVGRSAVIAKLREVNVKINIKEFKPSEIMDADMVFTTSVTGIHYISKINSTGFDVAPIEFLENLFIL